MHINEIARSTGVSLRSLGYYEEKDHLNPIRLENGFRQYSELDIEQIRIIQLYFSMGLNTMRLLIGFILRAPDKLKMYIYQMECKKEK